MSHHWALLRFSRGYSKNACDIAEGDESWFDAYAPETIQQSIVWGFQNKSNPTKLIRFKANGSLIMTQLYEKRRIVEADGTHSVMSWMGNRIRKRPKN